MTTMDATAVPEHALSAFESNTGLVVTLHDREGYFIPWLLPQRRAHRHVVCQAAKLRDSEACFRHDIHAINRDLPRITAGVVRVCPFGVVELTTVVRRGSQPSAVLFAGPRQVGRLTDAIFTETVHGSGANRPIDQAEAEQLLELLRQLAARLELWLADWSVTAVPEPSPDRLQRTHVLAQRSAAIRRFIDEHAGGEIGIADLAKALGLSPSRAMHVVRASCGSTFGALLTAARLERAATLLRHSELPVTDIAQLCGFADVSTFHRRFRRHFTTTPHRHRRERGRGTIVPDEV